VLRLVARALVGRLEEAREFVTACVPEVVVETRHRRVRVATDGEVCTMTSPLRYRIRPRALRVLVPPEA
jgi:diacylglycerol kinase family enzyme